MASINPDKGDFLKPSVAKGNLHQDSSGFTEDEARVDALILEVLNGITNLNGRQLRGNHHELTQSVHVLQSFVRHSAAARLGLFNSSDWWVDVI